jgi:hypothetical protein
MTGDLEAGDRVLLRGTVESVHDGFAMVRVDDSAPHAIPQRYDLVAVRPAALEHAGGADTVVNRERDDLRDYLDDFTRAVIDLDAGRGGSFARAAHSVRKKTGLPPVEVR